MRILFLSLLVTVLLFLSACGPSGDQEEVAVESKGEIVAVNAPLHFFASTLCRELATITMPVSPGIDPATWSPALEDLLELQQAELVILNGAGYSSWLDKVSLPRGRLVDTGHAFEDELIPIAGDVTHSHGPEGEHAHGRVAFTTWMDMSLAMEQAEAVADACSKRWPTSSASIQERKRELLDQLTLLDQGYQAAAAGIRDRKIIYSHPVYQYFERRYNLPGTSLHWEPDEYPTDQQWRRLNGLLDEGTEALLVWEASPMESTLARLRELDVESIVVSPAAGAEPGAWYSIQRDNLKALEGPGIE